MGFIVIFVIVVIIVGAFVIAFNLRVMKQEDAKRQAEETSVTEGDEPVVHTSARNREERTVDDGSRARTEPERAESADQTAQSPNDGDEHDPEVDNFSSDDAYREALRQMSHQPKN